MADTVPDWATQSQVPDWANSGSAPAWAAPAGAQPGVTAQGIKEGGIITEPDQGSLIDRLNHLVHGAYMGADLQGFGGLVARNIDKLTGYAGTPWSDQAMAARVSQDHPGQDPTVTKALQAAYERRAMLDARQRAASEVQASGTQGFNPAEFAAGVVGSADPSWAINPGAGIAEGLGLRGAAGVAAKVVGNAGAHAVMGSADDAAYQVADQIDGLQKDFDIKRNLQAAAMSGAFGAAHAGISAVAPVVSDFVADLFKQRGIDTTPADNPLASKPTTPLTGQGLAPEDSARFQELLNTGSEQDIKGFFKDRQGPAPSWADVHEWIGRRDDAANGIAPADYADPSFRPEVQPYDQREAVQQHIDYQTQDWKNKPDFEVINHVNDIADPEVRQSAINEGADDPNALGFLGNDGKVRVFANRIDSPDTLNAVLYHESLGHYGLSQQFGNTLDKTLQTFMDRNIGKFNTQVDQWIKDNPGAYGGDRVRAAEEVLANMSNEGQIKPVLADALTARVRDFGRQMGLNLSYSDNEIRTILGMAHNAVINGNGRNVVANGFKFMKSPTTEEDQTPRFMRRSDLASEKDYQVKALDEAYKGLTEGYEPTVRSFEEVRRSAIDAGFSPSQIKDLGDVGELDKKLYRIGAAARVLDTKISDLHTKFDSGNFTFNDKANYLKAVADYTYMLERIRDNKSEIARALNISKTIGYTKNDVQAFKKALEESGNLSPLSDDETFNRWLRQNKAMMASGNPAGAHSSMTSVINKPYWEQYLLSYRHNMMLSGLSTHIKNFVDNATTMGKELEEQVLAMPAGSVRTIINSLGGNVQTGVHPTEVVAHLWGLTRAALDATTWAETSKAFLQGSNGHQLSKNVNMADARIPVISKIGDALHAADTFFRSFMMNQNLYTLGTRQAYAEMKAGNPNNVKWDDVLARGSNYALSPTSSMLEQAKANTDQALLVNKAPLNANLDRLKAYRPNMTPQERMSAFFWNVTFPFIRVSSNAIQNQIIRRSPLALVLDKVTQEDLKVGGARADIAWMRMALGTAIMVNAWNMAGKGKTTGDLPDSPTKAAAMRAGGFVPQAVHENGKYETANALNMSLNPLDLHNATATMIAGIRQAYDAGTASKGQVLNGIKMGLMSTLQTLASQSFINNLTPVVDAMDSHQNTEGKATRFIAGEARTLMPNMTNQAAKIIDPNQHDTSADGQMGNQIASQIESNIPGATKNLPIKYSVYGEPLKTGTTPSGIHTWVSEGNHQNEPTDPAMRELSRLEGLVKGTMVTPVTKNITIGGQKTKLNSEQFEQYQQLAGRAIVETVRQEMQNPSWAKMSDQDKILEVRDIERDMKKAAKEHLYGE